MADWAQVTADFRQKFQRCYVNVVLEGRSEKELFYVKEVQDVTESPPELHLYNPNTGTIVLKYDTASSLHFDYPELGFFFYINEALLCLKKVERQYARGFGPSTCKVHSPYSVYCPYVHVPPMNFDMAAAAFQPLQPIKIADAVKTLLEEKIISLPLSRELALGQQLTAVNNQFLVWWYDNPIGVYTEGRFDIFEKAFVQEVTDYLRSTNQEEYGVHPTDLRAA